MKFGLEQPIEFLFGPEFYPTTSRTQQRAGVYDECSCHNRDPERWVWRKKIRSPNGVNLTWLSEQTGVMESTLRTHYGRFIHASQADALEQAKIGPMGAKKEK